MKERILPEFQDFLLSRSLVPEKNVSFYAYWVSKFLAFSNRNEDLGPDLRFQKFLNQLKSQKKIADWQIRQAEEALRLYFHHFLDGKISILSPNLPQKSFPILRKSLLKCVKRYASSIILTERNVLIWTGLKGFFITSLR